MESLLIFTDVQDIKKKNVSQALIRLFWFLLSSVTFLWQEVLWD